MDTRDPVDTVNRFWDEVWNAHDAAAVDRFVSEDFVIVTGGRAITGRDNFKAWVNDFLNGLTGLHLEVLETFQSADGRRVTSRWLLTGRNNGILGTAADQQRVAMTGTAVWAVDADGTLTTNWVERSSWETFQQLTAGAVTGR
ncbi:ester cyclase [Mycobacterium sp. NPDC050041]|uniref:ester cyclase n=1 Tax=Mycobacterium sp. NPDC050041 TaxID=3364293 RepID=UPI003C2FA964